MTAYDVPEELSTPLLAGVLVVVATVIVLLIVSKLDFKAVTSSKGSSYVFSTDGSGVVRRSNRSTKKPNRWEPPTQGPGDVTPPPKHSSSPVELLEKVTPKAVKTPRATAAAIAKTVQESTPVLKKGPGRPKKTPTSPARSPVSSPARRRRAAKSP